MFEQPLDRPGECGSHLLGLSAKHLLTRGSRPGQQDGTGEPSVPGRQLGGDDRSLAVSDDEDLTAVDLGSGPERLHRGTGVGDVVVEPGRVVVAPIDRRMTERQVRGGVERTFRVVERAVSLGQSDLADLGADEHFRYFATFVGTVLADFAAYLDGGQADLETDRVGYRQVALWLTDDEFDEMAAQLRSAVEAWVDQGSGPGRRRRLVTSIVMPDDRDLS